MYTAIGIAVVISLIIYVIGAAGTLFVALMDLTEVFTDKARARHLVKGGFLLWPARLANYIRENVKE